VYLQRQLTYSVSFVSFRRLCSPVVWMIVCLVFVFASLIEYAVVNVLARRTGKLSESDDDADGAAKRPPRSRAVRSALTNQAN